MVLRAQMRAWERYEELHDSAAELGGEIPRATKASLVKLQSLPDIELWSKERAADFAHFEASAEEQASAEAATAICRRWDVRGDERAALQRCFDKGSCYAHDKGTTYSLLETCLLEMGGDYTPAEINAIQRRLGGSMDFARFLAWWAGGLDAEPPAKEEHAVVVAPKEVPLIVEEEASLLLDAPLSSYTVLAPPTYTVLKASRREVAPGVSVLTEQLLQDGSAVWRYTVLCARCQNIELTIDFDGSTGVELLSEGGLVATKRARPFEPVVVATLRQRSPRWSLKCAMSVKEYGTSSEVVVEEAVVADGGYVDGSFPPAPASLGDDAALREAVDRCSWRRAPSFAKSSTLAPRDVRDGQLSELAWLAGALTALAERTGLLESKVEPRGPHRYGVSLCVDGEPVVVDVDDYLPCHGRGGPLFTAGVGFFEEAQLPAIIEKAAAKAYGSYAALRRGTLSEGLLLLTGAPTEAARFRDARTAKRVASGALWDDLRQWVDGGAVVSVSLPESDEDGGTRSFAIVAALEVRVKDSIHNVVKLRDAAGCELLERYPAKSALTTALRVLDDAWAARVHPNLADVDDGCVWVGWSELVARFDSLSVCHVATAQHRLWESCRRKLSLDKPAAFLIRLKSSAHLVDAFVSVEQRGARIFGTGGGGGPYVDLALMVLRERLNGGYDVVFAAFPSLDRLVSSGKLELAPGAEYICLAWSSKPTDVVLTVHADSPISFVRSLSTEESAEALSDATTAAVRRLGEASPYPEHGFAIYTLSRGNGVTFAVENLQREPLVFTMDCANATNAESHRGRLSWTEQIEPRSVEIVHHLIPAGPGTWSWSYECEWSR